MRKAILLLSLSVVQTSSGSGSLQFKEGAAEAGIEFHFVSGSPDKPFIIETISGGVALFDYDNDGWLDIYLVNGNTVEEFLEGKRTVRNALYRNRGDGTFRDVTLQAGVPGGPWDMGAVAADVDNDGFQDLFLTGFDRNTLFRNNGDGTFSDITASSGLTDKRWGAGAAFRRLRRGRPARPVRGPLRPVRSTPSSPSHAQVLQLPGDLRAMRAPRHAGSRRFALQEPGRRPVPGT